MNNDGMETEKVDVIATAQRLAQILKDDPQGVDKADYQRGEQLLTFFQDSNFGANFKGLAALKTSVIQMAIDDLSERAKILSKSFIGVSFSKNKLTGFECEYGEAPEGTVVYKVGLRDVVAFQNWRSGQTSEITPEDINSAIYRLTVEWSRLL